LPCATFDDRPGGVNLQDSRFEEFIRGYRSARELTDEQLAQIPLFLRFSNMLKYAELLAIVEEESQSGEPDWLAELRQKLSGMVGRYRVEMGEESR